MGTGGWGGVKAFIKAGQEPNPSESMLCIEETDPRNYNLGTPHKEPVFGKRWVPG